MRAPTAADAAAIAALYADMRATDAEEVRSWFRNPTFDIQRDFRVFERDGAIVGYVDVHREEDRLSVDWAARDPVSSGALLDWADERAREEAVERVRAWVWQPTAPEADVLRRRGFAPVRSSFEMHVELPEVPQEPAWPDGVVVRTVHEGEEPLIHELLGEAFADGNDFRPTPYEEWRGWALDPKRFDRDFWFLVLADDEAVAVAVCEPERSGRTGSRLGRVARRAPRLAATRSRKSAAPARISRVPRTGEDRRRPERRRREPDRRPSTLRVGRHARGADARHLRETPRGLNSSDRWPNASTSRSSRRTHRLQTDGKRHPNTCPKCDSHYRDDELESAQFVCAHCGHHFPVPARKRIEQLADAGIVRRGGRRASLGGPARRSSTFGRTRSVSPRPS